MTIKQALKSKNRLVKEINDLNNKAKKNNSVIKDSVSYYDTVDCFTEAWEKTEELVVLKSSIHKANVPVVEKILKLSEIKNKINTLKDMSTKEGIHKASRYDDESVKEFIVAYTELDVDVMIKEYEAEIDSLQDELDHFNAITKV